MTTEQLVAAVDRAADEVDSARQAGDAARCQAYEAERQRRPRSHAVDAGAAGFRFTPSTPRVTVMRAPRPRVPKLLGWLGKEILRTGLREGIREILDALSELFRRRAARARVP